MSSFALPSSVPPSHLTSPKIKWCNLTRLQTSTFEFVVTTGVPCATFPAKSFVLGPVPIKDRCNRSFFYYFIWLLFFYYLKALYFTFTYKWKKKKCKKITKLQDYHDLYKKKIIITLTHKKNLSDVNCCSKLISDKISRISFKKLSLMFKDLIEFDFVKVAIERKTVAKFSKLKIEKKKIPLTPIVFVQAFLTHVTFKALLKDSTSTILRPPSG